MPKFFKTSTVDGVIVLVPDSYYSKLVDKIRSNVPYLYRTRMYTYWLDSDGVMWRHPNSSIQRNSDAPLPVERVISQWSFNPEVYFV